MYNIYMHIRCFYHSTFFAMTEAYLEPCQTYTMEFLCENN